MRRARPIRTLLALTALCVATAGGITTSGATFTAATAAPDTRVTAAADWIAPTVSLADPGSPLRGTVALTATAADSATGVASVRMQRAPAGTSAWSDICTDTTSPYQCAWATGEAQDGPYDLRAVAVDLADNARSSSAVANRMVDNGAPTVTLAGPGDAVRGTITLAATASDGTGSGVASVRIERAVSGDPTWTTVCTDTSAPYSCPLNTAAGATPDGEYDFRAVATDLVGITATSTAVELVEIDNSAPTVTMSDPGSSVSGVVTLAATASDALSGVATVTIRRSPAGLGQWTAVCVDELPPYTCRFDTTTVPDGLYDLQAIAVDLAGNATTSSTVAGRRVDNTVPTISLDDPGAYLRGTVALSANANSGSGVASVRIQRAPAGKTTWTDICTDTTAPYGCAFDTATAATPDGSYDLRAIMTTGLGANVISATVAARLIDNTPTRGVDVQGTNVAGGTAGRFEAGDVLTLTYSTPMQPQTLISGWTGTGTASLFVRVRDSRAAGTSTDMVQLTTNAAGSAATGLGSVALGADYVGRNKTVVFPATATLTTAAAGGSIVTITLGTTAASTGLKTRASATTMLWTPSAAALDLAGAACSVAPVSETGAADVNF